MPVKKVKARSKETFLLFPLCSAQWVIETKRKRQDVGFGYVRKSYIIMYIMRLIIIVQLQLFEKLFPISTSFCSFYHASILYFRFCSIFSSQFDSMFCIILISFLFYIYTSTCHLYCTIYLP